MKNKKTNEKTNEKIQDLMVYCHSEMLRASSRARKTKNPKKQRLLREYQALWSAAVSILEHIDSEDYIAVR